MRAAGCTSRALLPNEAKAPRRLEDIRGLVGVGAARWGPEQPPRRLAGGCSAPQGGRAAAPGLPSRAGGCPTPPGGRPGGCPALPGLPAGPAITGETTSTPRASPVQLYAWIRVPERPAMASAALLSNPMTQVRPGWLSANLMAALTFGSMEPLPNCPSSR